MKKFRLGGAFHVKAPFKFDLKMKLTTLFLFVSLFTMNANSYAQNTKITLNLENVTVSELFAEIESLTDFRFLYNHNKVDVDRKVSVSAEKELLSEVLDSVFTNTNTFFKVRKKLIILKKRRKSKIKTPAPELVVKKQPVQSSIQGTVTDETGAPLPGASIVEKGTTNGAQSDFDGKFSLEVADENATLVISYLGFATQEIPLNGQTTLSIALKEDAAGLEEVVVVGYGKQKKVNLTGSIVTVTTEDFENRNVSNAVQALQGKVAGLRVTQTSGAPGNEDITFQIRGVNSFSADPDNISSKEKNKPLILINGLVGSITDLDPAFIESVTVLKDAASASIYGARAANGVILVTTTKGALDGTTISYTGRVMNQKRINTLERNWESVPYMEKVNKWLAPYTGRFYSEEVINNFRNNPSDEFPSFNHEDFYLHDVTIQSHNLQFGGTSGKTRYNVGLGYWDQDGIADGFTFEKTNGLVNVESQVNDNIKIGAYVNGTLSKRTEPYNGERDYLMGIVSQSPTFKPWLLDGSGRYTGSNAGTFPESQGYADVSSKNPFAISNSPNALTYDNRFALNANAFFEAKLFEGLTWYTKAGADITQTDYKNRRPVLRMYSYRSGEFQSNLDNIGSEQLIHRVGNTQHYTVFSHLNYQRTINEDHNFGLMVGVSQETDKIEILEGTRRGFASPNLDVLDGAPSEGQENKGSLNEFVLRSTFGRFTYNYKSKYLLEANFRRDGSSRFQQDNRYGFFPSFSAAWRLSEEGFMEGASDWLTNLKFRLSYGKMGNDLVGLYPYQSVLALGKDYSFGTNLQGGALREALSNPDIRWEETEITDIGMDLNLWGGLFSATFDYYDKTTDGILRLAQLPQSSGLLPPFVNEGVVKNKGFELILGHQNTIGELTYSANFNFSRYRNKLLTFGTRTFDTNAFIEGKEINRFYLYQDDGIFQSQAEIDNGPTQRWPAKPGDIRYKDIDGDGIITPDDRVDVDGVNPDFFYGFEISAQWKGFDFSAFFQGEKGRKVLVNDQWSLVLPFSVHGANPITWWDDSWTADNPSTTKPRALAYSAPEGQSIKEPSTFWLRDTSYMRLKNLSLGYSLPSKVMDGVFLKSVRLFANAENLVTFSKFEFGDPERPGDNLYPVFRTLTLGATIKF